MSQINVYVIVYQCFRMNRWNSVMPNAMITCDAVATAAMVLLGSDAELDVTVNRLNRKINWILFYSVVICFSNAFFTFWNVCFYVYFGNVHSEVPSICLHGCEQLKTYQMNESHTYITLVVNVHMKALLWPFRAFYTACTNNNEVKRM